MPLMSMRTLRTYRRSVERLPGEPERDFAARAERAIPDLRRHVEGRHHGRHLRCVVRYSDDMGLASIEVAALKERWEP
jgi:hypothetical protein